MTEHTANTTRGCSVAPLLVVRTSSQDQLQEEEVVLVVRTLEVTLEATLEDVLNRAEARINLERRGGLIYTLYE